VTPSRTVVVPWGMLMSAALATDKGIDKHVDHFVGGPRHQEAALGEEHGSGKDHVAIFDGKEPRLGLTRATGVGDNAGHESQEVAVLGLAECEEATDTLIEPTGI